MGQEREEKYEKKEKDSVSLKEQLAAGTDRREIYRYLGCRGEKPGDETEELAESCILELSACVSPRFFGREYPVFVTEGGVLDFSCFQAKSESLRKNLEGCGRAFLFGATLGAGPDLLIRRYSVTKISRAVVMQAAAAAMTETYCNLENDRLEKEYEKRGLFLRPRFSPGYGDFSLECQRMLVNALELEKRTGITLTGSLLMVPSKSVTAVIGIAEKPGYAGSCEENMEGRGCRACTKKDCLYREI